MCVSSFAQLLDFHKDDKGQKMTTSPACLWQAAMSGLLQVLGPNGDRVYAKM